MAIARAPVRAVLKIDNGDVLVAQLHKVLRFRSAEQVGSFEAFPDGQTVRLLAHVCRVPGKSASSLFFAGGVRECVWFLLPEEKVVHRSFLEAPALAAVADEGDILWLLQANNGLTAWHCDAQTLSVKCTREVHCTGNHPLLYSAFLRPLGNAEVEVLVGTPDARVIVWASDKPSGHSIRTNDGCVFAVAADANHIFTGSDDRTVRAFRRSDEQQIFFSREHEARVWAVALAGDGSLLSAGEDGQICRYDWRAGKLLFSSRPHGGSGIRCLYLNGGYVFTGADDSSVVMSHEVLPDTVRETLRLGPLRSLAAISSGGWAAVSENELYVSRRVSENTVESRTFAEGVCAQVICAQVICEGLVVGTADGELLFWDESTLQQQARLTLPVRGRVSRLICLRPATFFVQVADEFCSVVSHDSSREQFAVSSCHGVDAAVVLCGCLWRGQLILGSRTGALLVLGEELEEVVERETEERKIEKRATEWRLKSSTPLSSAFGVMGLRVDGSDKLVVLCGDGDIYTFSSNLEPLRPERLIRAKHVRRPLGLLTQPVECFYGFHGREFFIEDSRTGQVLLRCESAGFARPAIACSATGADGVWAAVLHKAGLSISQVRLADQTTLIQRPLLDGPIRCLVWAQCGSGKEVLLAAGDCGEIAGVNVSLKLRHGAPVAAMALDAEFLVVAGALGCVSLWQLSSDRESLECRLIWRHRYFPDNPRTFHSVAYRDGVIYLGASDGSVHRVSSHLSAKIDLLQNFPSAVLALDHNGEQLIAGCSDGSVHLTDSEGSLLLSYRVHRRGTCAVRFLGKSHAITGGDDHRIGVVALETGVVQFAEREHPSSVRALCIIREREIMTVCWAKQLYVYEWREKELRFLRARHIPVHDVSALSVSASGEVAMAGSGVAVIKQRSETSPTTSTTA